MVRLKHVEQRRLELEWVWHQDGAELLGWTLDQVPAGVSCKV